MLNFLVTLILMMIPVLVVLGIELIVTISAMEVSAVYHLFMILSGKESYGFFGLILRCIQDVTSGTDTLMNLNILCAFANILILGYWYLKKFEVGEKEKRSKLYFDKPKVFVALLAMAAGLQLVSSYITSLVAIISPAAMSYYEELLEVAGLTSESITPVVILYAVIVGPLSEEVIFRGMVLRIGTSRMNFLSANIIQALLFGMFHMNLVQGLYAFVVGLFLGFVVQKCHSLKASYIFHLVFNFMGVFTGISTYADQILAKILVAMFTIALLIVGKNLMDDAVYIVNEKEMTNE